MFEKAHTMADEFFGRPVIVGLRSIRTLPRNPEVDELETDIVITGAFNNVVAAQLNPHRG